MATTISIEHAHERYFGAPDKYNAAVYAGKGPVAGAVHAAKEVDVPAGTHRVLATEHGAAYGAANIRLSGNWISARFEVGGQCFETIYPFMGTTGFWYTEGGRAFPPVQHHHLHVVVEAGPGGATVSWDEVAVEQFNPAEPCEIYNITHQYCGEEILKRSTTMMPFHDICHPVYAIYVRTDKPIRGAAFQLNKSMLVAPFVWDAANDRWVCVFQDIPADGIPLSNARTINMTKVKAATLHVDHDYEEVRVATWATNGHLTRIMSGMAGLAFCS
jgi:hypothetical protein